MIIIYYGLLLILLSRRQQSSNLSDYPIVYTPIIQKLVSTAAGIIPYYKAFGLQKLVINKNLKNAPTGRRVMRLCRRRVPPAAHVWIYNNIYYTRYPAAGWLFYDDCELLLDGRTATIINAYHIAASFTKLISAGSPDSYIKCIDNLLIMRMYIIPIMWVRISLCYLRNWTTIKIIGRVAYRIINIIIWIISIYYNMIIAIVLVRNEFVHIF